MSKPKYPLPDHDWEALIYRIIDGTNGDEESIEACEAIEEVRKERYALIQRLAKKEKA